MRAPSPPAGTACARRWRSRARRALSRCGSGTSGCMRACGRASPPSAWSPSSRTRRTASPPSTPLRCACLDMSVPRKCAARIPELYSLHAASKKPHSPRVPLPLNARAWHRRPASVLGASHVGAARGIPIPERPTGIRRCRRASTGPSSTRTSWTSTGARSPFPSPSSALPTPCGSPVRSPASGHGPSCHMQWLRRSPLARGPLIHSRRGRSTPLACRCAVKAGLKSPRSSRRALSPKSSHPVMVVHRRSSILYFQSKRRAQGRGCCCRLQSNG